MLSNVLDIRGRVREGVPLLPRWGTFLDFGVLKPGFGCIIKLKLTSILAPNIFDYSTRGGRGTVSVDTKGEGVGGGIPLPW